MTDSLSREHVAGVLRSTVPRLPQPEAATVDRVLDATARLFGVPRDEILGRGRHANDARQVAMAVLRATTTLSFPEIGCLFDGRDHTTVLAAVTKVVATAPLREWAAAVDNDATPIFGPRPAARRGGHCRPTRRAHHRKEAP